MSYVQAFINCDVPGFGDISTSPDNSTYTPFSVIGFATFRDWIAGLTSTVTGLTFLYDSGLDRVTIENTTVSQIYLRVSASTAQVLGVVSTVTTIPGSTTHTGGAAPAGIIPIQSLEILDSAPAQRADLRAFSHGRARSIVFGSGTYHRAKLAILYADLERLLSGPCSVGRIRIGDMSGSAYSSSNLGGHIEASVLRVNSPRELDDIEGLTEITLDVHASAYTAPDPFDSVFASLERGYSFNLYAKIEGMDRLFTEIDTGLSASPRTTSATLVIGSNTTIAWRAERDQGRIGGGPVQIGILDPDNEMGIFGRPTKKSEIILDVDFDHGYAFVSDPSAFPGPYPHTVCLGKEMMTLTAVAGQQLTLSRGYFGPKYSFPATGPSAYTTISDRCHVFTGKIVELWGQLLDPFGRSVASALDDQYCRMMYHGELTGTPGYDAGVWALHMHPLENRLKREIGLEFSHVLQGLNTGEDGTIAAFDPHPMAPLRSTDVFKYVIEYQQSAGVWFKNVFDVTAQDLIDTESTVFTGSAAGHSPLKTQHVGGADHAVSVQHCVKKVVEMSAAFLIKKTAASATDTPVDKYYLPIVQSVRITDSVLWFNVLNKINTLDGPFEGYFTKDIRITIHPPVGVAGTWWRRPVVISHDAPWNVTLQSPIEEWAEVFGTDVDHDWQEIGLGGKDCDFMTLGGKPDDLGLSGSFSTNPAGGVNVDAHFLADDGEVELIRAQSAMDLQDGRILLWKLTRTMQQTQAVDLFAHDVKITTINDLSGTFGVQIAKILEGSGTTSRGQYDVVGAHSGYGIEDIHIDEPTITGLQALSAPTFVAPKQSLIKLFGGLLASLRQAIGPVRSGQRLKIGLVTTRPVGQATMKIRDSDMRRDRAPSVQRVGVGPNIVEFERTRVPGIDTKTTITYRLLADIQARGGVTGKFALPGTNGFIFDALAAHAAGGIMMSAMDLIAYRLHLGPHKDWLPGQVCDIDITHPGVYDWHRDEPGLQALGVILDTRRRFNGECEVTVLVAAIKKPVALCPAVSVTALDGLDLTVAENTFPGGSAIFAATNQALVYRAGVLDNFTEVRIASIGGSGLVFTLDSAPSWLTALDGAVTASTGVFVTYPSDDNASITELQDKGFAHYSDGGTWE